MCYNVSYTQCKEQPKKTAVNFKNEILNQCLRFCLRSTGQKKYKKKADPWRIHKLRMATFKAIKLKTISLYVNLSRTINNKYANTIWLIDNLWHDIEMLGYRKIKKKTPTKIVQNKRN